MNNTLLSFILLKEIFVRASVHDLTFLQCKLSPLTTLDLSAMELSICCFQMSNIISWNSRKQLEFLKNVLSIQRENRSKDKYA